jgi:C-terminal processing protease CtpA/Prc
MRCVKPLTPIVKNSKYAKLTFDGEVFVLTSTKTFSSGMWFAIILQDNNLAKVIGEPSGGAPTGFGDTVKSTLPNSKLIFCTTYKMFFRPDGTKNGREADVDYPCDSGKALEVFKNLPCITPARRS